MVQIAFFSVVFTFTDIYVSDGLHATLI